MPDTIFPNEVFNRSFREVRYGTPIDFYIGTHTTRFPDRFGVLVGEKMINKSKELPQGKRYLAWGTLVWTKKVVEYWIANPPDDYNEAINVAMENFKWNTFHMQYYYDMATWKDYIGYIKDLAT